MIFVKNELKLLWPFYLALFVQRLFNFIPIIFILYFISKGFTYFQASFLFVALFLAPVVFEIPTGAISDIYGRKISVFIGNFIMGILILLVPFIDNMLFLSLIFFLIGFSLSLTSGADEAWVVDFLKKKKNKNMVKDFYIKKFSIGNLGMILSGLLCGFLLFSLKNIQLVTITYFDIIWIINSIFIIISSIILFVYAEEELQKKINKKNIIEHTWHMSKKGFLYCKDNKSILNLILASFFVIFVGSVFMILWQPLLIQKGIPEYFISFFFSLIGILGIILPFFVKKLMSIIKKEKLYLSICAFLELILILLSAIIVSPLAAFILLAFLGSFGSLSRPVERPYLQKFIPSNMRATVVSIESMLLCFGGAIAMLFAGFFSDIMGPKNTLLISGFLLIPAIYFYHKIKK